MPKYIIHRRFLTVLPVALALTIAGALIARASLYQPGATLNPDCAPGTPNCGVTSISILNDGNVGIGTTTPTSGRLQLQTGADRVAFWSSDGVVASAIFNGSANGNPAAAWFGTQTNHPLFFNVNGGDPSMAISTAGKVGIGKADPQAQLDNNGDFITKGPWADVRAYGATGDGVTDDTGAVQAALNASANVFFPAGTYVVSNLAPKDNQRIFGDGPSSILVFKPGSTGYMFESSTYTVQFEHLNLSGGSDVDRSGTTTPGTRSGIHMSAISPNSSIVNVSVHGFDNIGIGFNGNGSTRAGAPSLSSVTLYYNYTGMDTGVGATAGGEYIKVSNMTCHRNRNGLVVNSGNMAISTSHFNDNGYGVTITNAYNNAHGTITGSTINHNSVYGVYVDGAGNGFTITGNQSFYNDWYFNNATGFNIEGNNFGNINFAVSNGGTNLLRDNWFTVAPMFTRSSDNFVISGNYYGTTPATNSGNQLYGKLGINYDPQYSYGPNGIHVYAASAFAGTSTPNSIPLSSNVAIMTNTAQNQDIGGVLGLGGMYQTSGQAYSGVMFGGLKGGKLNSTSGDYNGYLGVYTNKNGLFREVARFDNDGNLGVGTSTQTLGPLTMGSGAYVTAGGVWTNASDRNLKENFATLTPASILERINSLPVMRWNYKAEDPSITHIGPVAQDFYAAFGLGGQAGQTSISTIDPAGVALLGIKALDEKIGLLQGSLNGNTMASSLSVYVPSNFSADSVGEARILAGQTSVRIIFSQTYAHQPIVTFAPENYGAAAFIQEKDATGFTLALASATTTDTTFDWHSFASPGAQLTVSDGTTQEIALVVAALPPGNSAPALTVAPFGSTPADDFAATSTTTLASATVTPPVEISSTSTPASSSPVAGTTTPLTSSSSATSGAGGTAQDAAPTSTVNNNPPASSAAADNASGPTAAATSPSPTGEAPTPATAPAASDVTPAAPAPAIPAPSSTSADSTSIIP